MEENLYSSSSLLLSTWILHSKQNPFLGYHDGKFWFADGEHTIQFLISGYHDVNPAANIHEFEKCRAELVVARRKASR
jgi:hypothetical protein